MYGIYANIWGILMGSMLPYMAYMDPMGYILCIYMIYDICKILFFLNELIAEPQPSNQGMRSTGRTRPRSRYHGLPAPKNG